MSNPISTMRELRRQDGLERWTRRTEKPLLVLALLFLVVLLAPYFADLGRPATAAVVALNVGIWLVFAVDYVVRLYLAHDRRRFVRRNPLDLLIVLLPMLRPLRALRLLQILRVAGVAGLAQQRVARSLHLRVMTFVVTTVVVSLLAAAVAVREAERGTPGANIDTLGDGLWWAVTTVTTVGYGDQYPVTALGRVVAVVLMILGIALLGVITATIAAWFVDRLQDVEDTVSESEGRTEVLVGQALAEVLAEVRELRRTVESLSGQSGGSP